MLTIENFTRHHFLTTSTLQLYWIEVAGRTLSKIFGMSRMLLAKLICIPTCTSSIALGAFVGLVTILIQYTLTKTNQFVIKKFRASIRLNITWYTANRRRNTRHLTPASAWRHHRVESDAAQHDWLSRHNFSVYYSSALQRWSSTQIILKHKIEVAVFHQEIFFIHPQYRSLSRRCSSRSSYRWSHLLLSVSHCVFIDWRCWIIRRLRVVLSPSSL